MLNVVQILLLRRRVKRFDWKNGPPHDFFPHRQQNFWGDFNGNLS
jgi:hypothetical protein